MINKVVNTFYTASEHHKKVNSFAYEIPSKIVGNGEDLYPMVLLEEPLRFNGETTSALNTFTVNVCVMTNEDKPKVVNQEKCERILYDIVAYVNKNTNEYFKISDIDIVSLSRYNDDDTDGVRATLRVQTNNRYNICIDDEFDEDKEFSCDSELPIIDTEGAQGCNNTFKFKLPKI